MTDTTVHHLEILDLGLVAVMEQDLGFLPKEGTVLQEYVRGEGSKEIFGDQKDGWTVAEIPGMRGWEKKQQPHSYLGQGE